MTQERGLSQSPEEVRFEDLQAKYSGNYVIAEITAQKRRKIEKVRVVAFGDDFDRTVLGLKLPEWVVGKMGVAYLDYTKDFDK